MKVLMFFWDLEFFNQSYMGTLTKSISDHLGQKPHLLHIGYVEGTPKKKWEKFWVFHKLNFSNKYVKSKMVTFFLIRKKIYDQIRGINVDVIFSPSEVWAQELSRFCSKKMEIPYIIWLRGDHQKVRKIKTKNWFKREIIDYIEKRSLKDASLVIPCSKNLQERAIAWGVKSEKITKPIYNGIDTRMFKPIAIKRQKKFTIGYAGRISPEKGILRLFKLAKKMIGIHIIVAGKKQMDVNFPQNIEYMGEIPFSRMPRFYNMTDIIILPSFTEGFANVILEAYACAKPVIVATEAFPEELKIFGTICSAKEFDNEIKKLKKSNLKIIGNQARKYVIKNYSWNIFGTEISRFIEFTKVPKKRDKLSN